MKRILRGKPLIVIFLALIMQPLPSEATIVENKFGDTVLQKVNCKNKKVMAVSEATAKIWGRAAGKWWTIDEVNETTTGAPLIFFNIGMNCPRPH